MFLDRIQHVYRDPTDIDAPIEKHGDEGGIAGVFCHNQIACHDDWLDLARAVAGIGTAGENSIWCTGQLIRTETDDLTPYFLTAHHCLSSNYEARASEIYFDYQAATCGGQAPGLRHMAYADSATLVSTGAGTDYTLLLIEGAVSPTRAFAPWTSADAADGTAVACIHHPLGKQKRISFGTKASNPTCGTPQTHVRSNWSDGVTQPGSSGSGLFREDTGELIGQLHCGSSDCGNVTNDSYGAFYVTYPFIADALVAGTDDAFEPNLDCASAAAVTPGVYPGLIVKSGNEDWYRIHVPPFKRLTVRAQFRNTWGDVDMQLFNNNCGGSPIDSSAGTGNVETVAITNNHPNARNVRLRVFAFDDVRAHYKLTVTLANIQN
jgi:hypothetical protein